MLELLWKKSNTVSNGLAEIETKKSTIDLNLIVLQRLLRIFFLAILISPKINQGGESNKKAIW